MRSGKELKVNREREVDDGRKKFGRKKLITEGLKKGLNEKRKECAHDK